MYERNYVGQLVVVGFLIAALCSGAWARSVYVINNHYGNVVTAYNINGEEIEYQTEAEDLPTLGRGPVGLAIDPCSETMFVTYERYDVGLEEMAVVNAKTMIAEEDTATITGAFSLAGIVFDEIKQKLYAIDRELGDMYVCIWDPDGKRLVLEDGGHKTLQYGGGIGLALDSGESRLFVTNKTNIIRYYDTNDPNFGYLGSIEITVGDEP